MFAMSDGRPAPANPAAVVQGDTYRFTVLTPRLIRMEWSPDGRFVDERSQLVVDRDFPVPAFTVTQVPGGGLEILTDYLRLRYDGGEFTSGGLSVTLTRDALDAHYSVWHYGMSYPQDLPFRGNLLGTARTLDEVDGATELDEGILSTFGFALVDDSHSVLLSDDGWITPRPDGGAGRKDLYLLAYGRDIRGAFDAYHHLTGPTPLVPRYTLGNWWSRYWRYTEDSYVELMDRFRDEGVPLSVSVIDMDWHQVDVDPEIGTGWTGYSWDRELFPDPERFLAALHERGLAVTLNVHPADGVRRHEDAYPEMARALGIDPASGLPVGFDITDRTFVDAYLRLLHHPLEEQGVDFWWLDWQSGGVTSVPGLDPLWMLNHIHFRDSGRERTDGARRPLTFSRYAGLGSHRYPVGFSGDTIITWDSLDFQPYFTNTAANVAFTWWSHDIGGHMFGGRDVEMATRWYQYGVFSPINRLHSSNSPFTTKEPWAFGPRAQGIMSRFLRLRHRLVPALYTAAWAAHADNVAVVRPMYHDHPDRVEARTIPNQAMLGEHLLVAPITRPEEPASGLGTTRAWLPEGGWFDLFTGQRYRGGRFATFHRPLEVYPVLARAGAVLPLAADPFAPVGDVPDALELRVFPGDGVSHLVEDHGEAAPGLADRNVTRFVQTLTTGDAGEAGYGAGRLADLVLRIEPTTGPDPLAVREVTLDVVGAVRVERVVLAPFGALGTPAADDEDAAAGASGADLPTVELSGTDASVVAVHRDELLAPALRVRLGEVDLARGLEVRLIGLEAAPDTLVEDTFALLDAAEIPFWNKEHAWRTVKELTGLELAQEIGALQIPAALRGALIERAAVVRPW
ncbi:alpha-glucosidase (family GH31 glycosyl hydrolase) [Salana multivorans]|uniref:Alpha-glucosidase (Family GH31 glycosyl hydrolase) n=1 Tax=Salana multivorans TaxID=120377 RepID=A0A3N2D9F0_9MICO|nr:glycoside hydrolase family 31 protein [Salana multivorans]ROR96393.1 alpha-glucosidase (family GH31 glycosyl hydrolase) [Salana multivorans]